MNTTTFKTISLGEYKTSGSLVTALEKENIQIGTYARQILQKVTPQTKKEDIDLCVVSVKDLGFSSWATRTDIFARARELGLELCPPETGPLLRLAYPDQPLYEWLRVAMEPIADSDGNPNVFNLERNDDGLWLYVGWAGPDREWNPDDEFVFRLRKPLETKKLKKETLGDLDSLTLASDLPDTLIINNVKYVRAK